MSEKTVTQCTSCEVRLRVSASAEGKRLRCPKCGERFRVAAVKSVARPSKPRANAEASLESQPPQRKRSSNSAKPKPAQSSGSRTPIVAGALLALLIIGGRAAWFLINHGDEASQVMASSDGNSSSQTLTSSIATQPGTSSLTNVAARPISNDNPFEEPEATAAPVGQTPQKSDVLLASHEPVVAASRPPVTLTSTASVTRPGDVHVVVPATNNAKDWLQFRGSDFNRTSENSLPTTWSETENVAWKCDLPGMGTSSPIVVGNRIYLTSYSTYGQEKENPGDWQSLERHVICVDRSSGNIVWNKSIRAENKPHDFQGFLHLHGYASHSLTSDGQRIYAHLGNSGAFAFDMNGNQLWHTPVGTGVSGFGSAASPALYDDVVLINASIESQSLLALKKSDGTIKWETQIRDSYAIPVVAWVKDHHEVIVPSNGESVIGVNADTGKKLWNWKGQESSRYICASPILYDGVVFATGSVDGPLAAIRPGGRGDVTDAEVWRGEKYRGACPSPVFHDGRIYWLDDGRFAIFDAKSGETISKGRIHIPGGFYATPLVAGDRMYLAAREQGVLVVRLDDELSLIATNNVEARSDFSVNASPVPHNGQLLLRTNKALYCIGE